MPLLPYLERLAAGHNLSAEEAQSAMQTILDGKRIAGANRRLPDGVCE